MTFKENGIAPDARETAGPRSSHRGGRCHQCDATVGDAGESLVRLPRSEASDRADAFDLELDLEALAIAVAAAALYAPLQVGSPRMMAR